MSNDTRPEIRFPGFTEDWEERKLGELTESFDGKRVPIDSDLRISGKYPYYGATGIIDYVDDYIFNGEYVLLAEDGANIIMRNYPVAYLTQGKFWLNNHAHIMRMRNGSNYFLVQVLEKIDYKKYNTGTAQPKLNSKIVKNIELKIPHIEEQQQIGNFFKQLDDIIALHQRKLDLLKETKKGFLQKMFPKNGAKVPEIRFPGFTEDWEERKLNEGMTEYTDRVYIQDDEIYKQVSVKNVGEITLRGEQIGSKIGRKRQAKVNLIEHPDTLIFTRQTIEQGGIGFAPKETDGAIVTENMPTIDVDNDIINCNYLLAYVKTEDWYRKVILKNIEGGTAQIAIHEDSILFSEVLIPKIEEQQKIGAFFKQLDDTITLHQRKLDLLKETKKGFLQKMFV